MSLCRTQFHRRFPAICAWLAVALSAPGATTLTLGELEPQATTTGTVPVEFRSDVSVAAMQMDVLFDAAAYTSTSATAGTLPTNFRVDSYLLEPGRLRVVVGAPGNAVITDTTAFRVPLTAVNEISSAYPVVLTNFIFSTAGSTPVVGQLAPRVRLLNLASDGKFNAKGGLQLSVEAGATDGSVARVEFFAGDEKIGQSASAPFNIVWSPDTSGNYVLHAVAYDSNGLQTVSRSIPIVVYFNSAPISRTVTLSTVKGQAVSIPLAKLLAFASDVDGDSLSITDISGSSQQGGAVALQGQLVRYSPFTSFTGADQFTYTISDGHETAVGTVKIAVAASDGFLLNMVSFARTPEGFLLKFAGIPGNAYVIQFRDTLNTDDPWTTLNPPGSIQAGVNGLFEYEDKPSPIPPSRFYRAAEAP